MKAYDYIWHANAPRHDNRANIIDSSSGNAPQLVRTVVNGTDQLSGGHKFYRTRHVKSFVVFSKKKNRACPRLCTQFPIVILSKLGSSSIEHRLDLDRSNCLIIFYQIFAFVKKRPTR